MLSPDRRRKHKDGLGKIIKTQREKMGITQKDLAASLGLNYYTQISQMENGYMAIPPVLWVEIAITLNMDEPQKWVLTCLIEYQPDVYEALFQRYSKDEVAFFLQCLLTGRFDDMFAEERMQPNVEDTDNQA